jgi:diguanylate cyclase (GGDEF)-like protein/PAS domain S-box-containing protein
VEASRRATLVPCFSSLRDPESLRDLVQQLKEGVYITGADGRILDANPAFLEMLGVNSIQELWSLKASDLIVDPQERSRELRLLNRRGSVREYELRIRRPDGQIRTVIDTACVCRDPLTGETLYRGILVDISDRKRLEMQLVEQSVRDPLTGCYNRRWLPEFERHAKDKGWGCIAIDLDHFKAYNDRHGHHAGDALLVKVSRLLIRQARAEEGVVRMGGDEFAVLLLGGEPSATTAVAERLQRAARSQAPIGLSMGWATRQDHEKLERTLARADRNMFAIRIRRRSPKRERRNGSSHEN